MFISEKCGCRTCFRLFVSVCPTFWKKYSSSLLLRDFLVVVTTQNHSHYYLVVLWSELFNRCKNMSLNTTTTTDLLSKVHQYVADVSFFFFNSEHKMCICKSMEGCYSTCVPFITIILKSPYMSLNIPVVGWGTHSS